MRAFQWYVAHHMNTLISKQFPTFNARESNWHFDSCLFFDHNLCFKYSSGSCKPILDIYILRVFNNIKKFLIQWILTPKYLFEDLEFHRDSNFQNGNPLGNVWVHSPTLLGMQSDSWVALSTRTFPCLYLDRKLKAKVVTFYFLILSPIHFYIYNLT